MVCMTDKKIIILRGASGSGKSTVADLFAEPKVIASADDYFTDSNGNYNFDVSKLGKAHQYCRDVFMSGLNCSDIKTVIVSNTNTKPADYQFYVDEAKKRGIDVIYLVIEKRQRDNLKNDIKLG